MTSRNEIGISRRAVVAAAALTVGLVALGAPAHAQTYPTRPVRMIVPFPPGGALDVLGRIVADKMGPELGQPVVVENRPGATGHVGSEAVAKSAPDGYTLLFSASSTQVVSPHVMSLNYKPMDDLIAVALAATVNNMIVASPSLPVTTIPELIAYAKANPDKVTYGSFGVGSNVHLAGEMLGVMGGVKLRHVPYQTPQIIPDLLSGRLNMMVANIPDVAQHIAEGKLKAIGATSAQRLPDYPNVATVAETLPGYEVGAWGMVLAPKGTPQAIVDRLNAAVQKAQANPEVLEAFTKLRFNPAPTGVKESQAFMERHNELWAKVVREANVPKAN